AYFDASGSSLITSNKVGFQRWPIATRAENADLRIGPPQAVHSAAGKTYDASVSPDGHWVVTGTQHGPGIKIWDAGSGKLVRDLAAGSYGSGQFNPDGKWLVTTSKGEGTHIREVGSWEVRHHLSKNRCSGMAFAMDSSLLALTYENEIGTVILIDPVKGQEVARLPAPNPLPIGGMCFSDDGAQLAVACYNHPVI